MSNYLDRIFDDKDYETNDVNIFNKSEYYNSNKEVFLKKNRLNSLLVHEIETNALFYLNWYDIPVNIKIKDIKNNLSVYNRIFCQLHNIYSFLKRVEQSIKEDALDISSSSIDVSLECAKKIYNLHGLEPNIAQKEEGWYILNMTSFAEENEELEVLDAIKLYCYRNIRIHDNLSDYVYPTMPEKVKKLLNR